MLIFLHRNFNFPLKNAQDIFITYAMIPGHSLSLTTVFNFRCAQELSRNVMRGSLKMNDINEYLVDNSLGQRHYTHEADSLNLKDNSEADLLGNIETGSLVKRMADPSLLVRIGNINR